MVVGMPMGIGNGGKVPRLRRLCRKLKRAGGSGRGRRRVRERWSRLCQLIMESCQLARESGDLNRLCNR